MPSYQWQGDDLLLWLRVQPKASHDAFAGESGDALKVRITAPPVDGKANKHLLAWLAKQFGVAKSTLTLEAGKEQRNKRVRIPSPKQIPTALSDLIHIP